MNLKKFVINLKRRPDRLAQFFERCPFPQNEIEIVHGFDGKNPQLESEEEQEMFNTRFNAKQSIPCQVRNPGEKGVFISHVRIWKKMMNENIHSALIFEDDALFNSNFLDVFNEINNFESFDENELLFYLGGRFKQNHMTKAECVDTITKNIICYNYSSYDGHSQDRTCHAYILNKKTAELYLQLFKNNSVFHHVDHFMTIPFREQFIPIYSTQPLICWSPSGDSDIR